MERFIRKFQPTADQALALRTVDALSDIWNCGHRRLACMYRGQCVVQNIQHLAAYAETAEDRQLATQIVDVASALGNNRNEIRVQVSACNQRMGPLNLTALADQMSHAIAEAARSVGMIQLDRAVQDDDTRYYVDDSRSLLPHLYVPMRGDETPEIIDSVAIGNVLFLFYENFHANKYVYQRDPEALPITNHYLAWAPNAPRHGDDEPVTWIAYFQYSLRQALMNADTRPIIVRTLESDMNYIRAQSTRRGSRLFFQRFGCDGQGVGDTDALYQRAAGNRPSIARYCDNAVSFERLFFPSLLHRGWIAGVYTDAEFQTWFDGEWTCQSCYVAERTVHRRVLCVDTRTSEDTGAQAIRSLRPLRHGGVTLDGIRSRDLLDNEVLTRQGDHWCATVCRSPREAVYITATLVHRFMRGRGIGQDFIRTISAEVISRCYLQWLPERAECVVLFRLLAYAQQLYTYSNFVELGAWTDLGVFFSELFRGVRLGEASTRDVHAALLALARYHVHLVAQNGYTRPCAPPSRPRPLHRR
ncbi:TuP [Muko virus]|uniref:Non-structural protein NS1 n=1 Tax=Muko virus TaxID=1597962 RepID=A0A0P0YK82_9REOV|nr:TuP [Muko virus]